MRTRRSVGGVRKQNGRWYGLWYEGGIKKSKVLGFASEMTKGEAREAVAKIAAGANQETSGVMKFSEFVRRHITATIGGNGSPQRREPTLIAWTPISSLHLLTGRLRPFSVTSFRTCWT
jgi:hypothetical protein